MRVSTEQKLSAVILAGVHDWGACALNRAVLRPLAPIGNRPIIGHVLAAVARAGVRRVVISTNGHSQQLRESLGNFFCGGLHLDFRDDAMPRGPAGCVKDASLSESGGNIIVLESGTVPQFDIEDLVTNHYRTRAALTIAGVRTQVEDDDTYTPAGCYIIASEALAFVADRGFCDIKETLVPRLHDANLRVNIHPIDGHAPRLTGIENYFALNDWAIRLAASDKSIVDGYFIEGAAVIHREAFIHPQAKLLGPVMIGPDCSIEAGAILVGPTSMGRGAVIGEGCVVSRSALWANSRTGENATLDRCVVAERARISAGETRVNAVCLADTETTTQSWGIKDSTRRIESTSTWAHGEAYAAYGDPAGL